MYNFGILILVVVGCRGRLVVMIFSYSFVFRVVVQCVVMLQLFSVDILSSSWKNVGSFNLDTTMVDATEIVTLYVELFSEPHIILLLPFLRLLLRHFYYFLMSFILFIFTKFSLCVLRSPCFSCFFRYRHLHMHKHHVQDHCIFEIYFNQDKQEDLYILH